MITSEEAELRGRKYDADGRTYLFDLDFNLGDENPYTVSDDTHIVLSLSFSPLYLSHSPTYSLTLRREFSKAIAYSFHIHKHPGRYVKTNYIIEILSTLF